MYGCEDTPAAGVDDVTSATSRSISLEMRCDAACLVRASGHAGRRREACLGSCQRSDPAAVVTHHPCLSAPLPRSCTRPGRVDDGRDGD